MNTTTYLAVVSLTVLSVLNQFILHCVRKQLIAPLTYTSFNSDLVSPPSMGLVCVVVLINIPVI